MRPFLTTTIKDIISKHMDELNVTKEDLPCQSESEECLTWLKWYRLVMQLPFEINKFPYDNLGFGTYLAYFSRLLSRGEVDFFNKFNPTKEESVARRAMSKTLRKLGLNYNISTFELVKMLHLNPDETERDVTAFANPIQTETGCQGHETEDYMRAWERYKKKNEIKVEDVPCHESTNETSNCCKMFATLKDEVEIVLKIMKYSIQPPLYHEPLDEFIESFDNLEFLPYKNLTTYIKENGVKKLMETNTNPRIFMCRYSGVDKLLPPNCNLFHMSLTNQGMGYSFNVANFWDIFSHTKYTNMFAKIMRPKGYNTKASKEEFYLKNEDDQWAYPERGIISPIRSGPTSRLEVSWYQQKSLPGFVSQLHLFSGVSRRQ